MACEGGDGTEGKVKAYVAVLVGCDGVTVYGPYTFLKAHHTVAESIMEATREGDPDRYGRLWRYYGEGEYVAMRAVWNSMQGLEEGGEKWHVASLNE